jgi:Rrf2 family protein
MDMDRRGALCSLGDVTREFTPEQAMQELTARAEYALLAVLDLARHSSEDDPVKVGQVAERTGAPEKYLVQIFQELKKDLIVNGVRGRSGGYYLVRPPHQISVAQVLEAAMPDDRPFADTGARETADREAVRSLWLRTERERMQALSRVSIEKLVRQADAAGEPQA